MRQIPHSIRRTAIAGAAVLVLGGAAVGIAAAQSQPTATPSGQAQSSYQRFIDALAHRLNISSQTLDTAVGQARQDAGLSGNGAGFPGGFGRGGSRGGSRLDLTAAATAIGIPPAQLKTELAGKSIADVAQAHNKPLDEVKTALKNAAHQRVDAAVTAGRLTADQANTQKTQTDQRIDQAVTQVMPQGGGAGKGFGGRGENLGASFSAAATAIGVTPEQLRSELPGKSLADVAKAHNKPLDDVKTALKNAAHQSIDAAVTAGRLTADQANTQKTQADQRIDQLVNQVVPQRGPGRGAGPDIEQTGV
jgi:hypothetical protein